MRISRPTTTVSTDNSNQHARPNPVRKIGREFGGAQHHGCRRFSKSADSVTESVDYTTLLHRPRYRRPRRMWRIDYVLPANLHRL